VRRAVTEDQTVRRWPADLAVQVRATVLAHTPGDEREEQARARILESLDSLERPFDEEAGPRHVTASAVVVGTRGTVLHLHKRLEKWMQPGGHVDPGEAPWEAARRESGEETGLVVSHPAGGPRLIHVDVHEAAEGHVHFDLRYLLLAEDAEPCPGVGESPDVLWFAWDEAEARADVALRGALQVARHQPEVARGQTGAVGR
jgi:8-oxo-dGTP pyrophosphatase MutT (NUDIX family)